MQDPNIWDKRYDALEQLNKQLICPDDFSQIDKAIKVARHVESTATYYHTKFSRLLAEAKSKLSTVKLIFTTKLSQLISNTEFYPEESERLRKTYAETKLIEEFSAVERAKDEVSSCQLFIKALERVLGNAKHTREDIGRKIKLTEVQNDIKEL